MTLALALFLLAAVLMAADSLVTLEVLKLGGKEANPLVRWLIEKTNPVLALFGTKAAVLYAIWYINSVLVLYVVVPLYAAVVAWNLSVWNKIKKA